MNKLVMCLFFICANLKCLIHIIGDSHAFFNFASGGNLKKISLHEVPVVQADQKISIPVLIRWLGPRTMHRVGREGLKEIDIKKWEVQEGDTVVYVFGEIDVRCHILKQRDEGRDLEEVINVLVDRYLNALYVNHCQYNVLKTIVCNIVPPTDRVASKEFPVYGSLAERICITQKLNERLKKGCLEKGFLFLDCYEYYCTEYGDFKKELSDGDVHIAFDHNHFMKQELFKLVGV